VREKCWTQLLGHTRVILEHYLEMGPTLKNVGFSVMLSTELETAIRTKRRKLMSKFFGCSITKWTHIITSSRLNSCRTGYHGFETSCILSRTLTHGLPSFWPTLRCLKGPSVHLKRWSEMSGAWVASCTANFFFCNGTHNPLNLWNKWIARAWSILKTV
jgi:hypothetical protein